MIKVKQLDKYYNKNRSNEIHVINQTTIDFPKTGLVAITGPSGCGKTTLLNVIAGLDDFKSGEITYGDTVVKKYKSSVVDAIRNQHIGFIFQNYHLLPDKTVYENIQTALNLAGLYDKDQIEERINYSLEQVGMYHYRKRSVLALSGGQQQRVGIARAIAKNPDVILADEPTGNLDSNNTFEVMSLIKNISRNKLVILVTHERHLVDFYADRIIELKDGKVVNDYENFNQKTYDHKDERLIYLKDLETENLNTDFLEYYYRSENQKQFKIKVVEMNDTLYIQTNANKKVKIVDHESEVKLIDDHKKEVKVEDFKPLDFDSFEPIQRTHHKSLFRWRDTLLAGLKKFSIRRKFGKKLLLLGYFFVSGMIALQLSQVGNLIKIDETKFNDEPKSFVMIPSDMYLDNNDFDEILSVDGVELPYVSELYFVVSSQKFYQSQFTSEQNGYVVKRSWVNDYEMLAGDMVASPKEAVITSSFAESLIGWFDNDLGVTKPEQLVGFDLSNYGNEDFDFTVVGIIDSSERMVVVDDVAYPMFESDKYIYKPYDYYEDDIVIVDGRKPENLRELLVHVDENMEIGEFVNLAKGKYTFDKETFTVVGTYRTEVGSEYTGNNLLVTAEQYENYVTYDYRAVDTYYHPYVYSEYNFVFYAKDKAKAIDDLEELGYEAIDIYQLNLEKYSDQRAANVSSQLISFFVIISGIILFIFFMTRTSMIQRIKEIGIYRAIGATKRDVYKIFLSEILVYTTLASATGYALSSYLFRSIQNQVGDYFEFFFFPWWLFLLGLLGVYIINIIFGLLPIYGLLRKTPSNILSKYDI